MNETMLKSFIDEEVKTYNKVMLQYKIREESAIRCMFRFSGVIETLKSLGYAVTVEYESPVMFARIVSFKINH